MKTREKITNDDTIGDFGTRRMHFSSENSAMKFLNLENVNRNGFEKFIFELINWPSRHAKYEFPGIDAVSKNYW